MGCVTVYCRMKSSKVDLCVGGGGGGVSICLNKLELSSAPFPGSNAKQVM